jgi:predicted phage terminase large subunit-like protein
MSNLTTNDALEAERILCRMSFAYFVRRAWRQIIPDPIIWNWHLDAVCDHLEAVASGDINRLLINVPPGSSKSTLAGIMFPAWLWGPCGRPQARYIGAAHEQGLAVRDNRMTRELVTSAWYQRLWPLGIKSDQNEKLYFENAQRGFRQACAVASMTGRRGDVIVWDDPLSPEKAHSAAHRETATRILTETVPTRLTDPARSAVVVIMQRLHEADPSGYILANDLGYDHLCIPMEYDPGRNVATSIGWADPRSEPGELLDPVRFPAEVIERDKRHMGSYAWAGQMQQRPSPAGGGVFKADWWRFADAAPAVAWRSIYVDTAQKTAEANDYTVFQCWGKTSTGQAVLLDMTRGKWEAPELLEVGRAFWRKHKVPAGQGALRAVNVEDKVSGTGLIQTLRREGVPVVPVQRTRDKLTRAYDAAPFIESGNVILLRDVPHLSDMLAEASAFPKGAHDDTLDPMLDAVADICQGSDQVFGVL